MLKRVDQNAVDTLVWLEEQCFEDAWKRTQIEKEFTENPFSKALLFYEGDELVGYILLWIIFEQASIVRIGILPEHRRQNKGSAMLQEMLRALSRGQLSNENPVEQVNLEVDTENEAAIALYQKHGFVRVAKMKQYYENGSDAFRMLLFF